MSRITSTKPKTKTASKTPSHPHPTSTRLPKKPQRLHLTQPRKPPRLHLCPPKKPQRLILRPPQKPILRDRSPNRQTPSRGTMKIKEEDTVEPLERISKAATDDIDTNTHTSAAKNVHPTKIKKEHGDEEEEAEEEADNDNEVDEEAEGEGETNPLRTTWTAPVRSPRVRVPSEKMRTQFWQGEVGGIVFGEVKW